MQKQGILQRRLKDLDIYKRLPKNVSKGSLWGVVMTLICVITVAVLLVNEVIQHFNHEIESSLRVDHRKDDEHVEIHMKIDVLRFPCHLLSIDVVDYVGTHRMATHDTLTFTNIDPNGNAMEKIDMTVSDEEAVKGHDDARSKNYGCRLEGFITILMVPGNFHLAFHKRGTTVMRLYQERNGLDVDFTHTIHFLYFGSVKNHAIYQSLMKDFNLKSLMTLQGHSSTETIPTPGPYSYRYKLLIVPTDLIYEDGKTHDLFQYKTFWNVAMIEMGANYMIMFEYEVTSLSMVERRKHKYLSEFLIHISGIIGGLIAFMTFLHNLVQKSVIRLIQKHAMGKLE